MRTRRTKATVGIALATVIVASLTACNRDSSGDTAEAKDSITLAVSTLNNPFFVDLRDGAQAAADELGVTLDVVDAQNDSTTQANQIANAVTGKADGIIVNAVESDAAGPAIQPALTANVPVVGVDRAINGAQITSLISSDNVAGGAQAADALAAAIGEKGKVIVLQGVPGTSASNDRGKGFTEGLKAYPNIEIVAMQSANFDRAQGMDVATNLMQSNPGVVGIFAENDEMALGAIQAVGARAASDVKIVGFDGTADGLAAIKEGTLVATVAQQPAELGKVSVQTLVKVIAGETVKAEIPVPVQTVTSDNVKDFTS